MMQHSFGMALKDWRGRRRMSQLDLSGLANVSARHIAFLETGRARPSRGMVLQLSEALAVPRGERNALLQAAGFAPAYRARTLAGDDMVQVREAVCWMLSRHVPYPALALDRHWHLVLLNDPAKAMVASVGLSCGDSLIDALTGDTPLWQAIGNRVEVAHHLALRMRTESLHLGGDAVLEAAAEKLLARIAGEPATLPVPLPPVVPLQLKAGEQVLSFFSAIAQFGTAEDIALSDLRIELFFPADAATMASLSPGGHNENGPA
jgi:transcriptional regulator with XRE-family HTH domain